MQCKDDEFAEIAGMCTVLSDNSVESIGSGSLNLCTVTRQRIGDTDARFYSQ